MADGLIVAWATRTNIFNNNIRITPPLPRLTRIPDVKQDVNIIQKMPSLDFKPALIVVDVQEDFCPPVSYPAPAPARATGPSSYPTPDLSSNNPIVRHSYRSQRPGHPPHYQYPSHLPLCAQDRHQRLAPAEPHLLRLQSSWSGPVHGFRNHY